MSKERYHYLRGRIALVTTGEYDPYQLQEEIDKALWSDYITGQEYDSLMFLLDEWL